MQERKQLKMSAKKIMSEENYEAVFDAMLEEQAKKIAEEQGIDEDTNIETANVLNKFGNYIKSFKFDYKCRAKAKEAGIKNYKVLKSGFVYNILNKIANVLGLTINVVGDVITFALGFITDILCRIVDFATSVCTKIVNLITLNCGTAVA